jgi:hypothetical protein
MNKPQCATGKTPSQPANFKPKQQTPGQDDATHDNLKQQRREQIAAQMKK